MNQHRCTIELDLDQIQPCMGFKMELEQFMRTIDVTPEASGNNDIIIGIPLVSPGSLAGQVAGCHAIVTIAAFKSSMTADQIAEKIQEMCQWSSMCVFNSQLQFARQAL